MLFIPKRRVDGCSSDRVLGHIIHASGMPTDRAVDLYRKLPNRDLRRGSVMPARAASHADSIVLTMSRDRTATALCVGPRLNRHRPGDCSGPGSPQHLPVASLRLQNCPIARGAFDAHDMFYKKYRTM